MRFLKSLFYFVGSMLIATSITSCTDDWGRHDPAAGNQVNPTRQLVATYDFEYSDKKPEFSDLNLTNSVAEVVEDDSLGSNVLHLQDAGCARIANPFTSVKLQNGAGIAFWVKLDSADLARPLISFGSEETDSARFYFTANGQMSYSKPGQLESLNLDENNPDTYKTGMVSTGTWHYVALQISKTGYQFYVDGKKSLSGAETSQSATSFKYETLVSQVNNAPYIYIGTNTVGDSHNPISFDDIILVRNQMTESDYNKSSNGGGTSAFDYILEDPITEVGTSDCSAAWWTSFSNYYRIPVEGSIHISFTNHTSGVGNWNNWNLCLCTDAERSATGYAEYFVIRSDLYGWGDSYNAANFTNTGYGDWDLFRANMEGAKVDMDIKRSGAEIYVTATATCKDGTVYVENFHATCGDGTQVVRAFMIVDSSYLVIDQDNCYATDNVTVNTTEIGTADCTAAWWTSFSDYFQIPVGKTLNIAFTNHTSGAGNWNNWNLCLCTDADRSATGYAEYFVIRSDLYGWGDSYNGANFTNTGYGDWDLFRANMEGAKVNIKISRKEAEVYVTATATCTDGTVYVENFHATCGDGTQVVRAFLIVDSSYLVMDTNNCYFSKALYD